MICATCLSGTGHWIKEGKTWECKICGCITRLSVISEKLINEECN